MSFNETGIPEIDIERVKKLTIRKIQKDRKGLKLIKAACAVIAAALVTTGSVYAFGNEGFQSLITQLTGVQQAKVLTVGEAVRNRDYKLKVHEIVTDSYVGDVVVSVEALREKSKETFESYRIDLKHIGSGYGLKELTQYREPYVKYYEISFSGAKNSYNKGRLEFSVEGMREKIEVPLAPTVKVIDMDIPEDSSNGYKYKFDKLHLSEIGLTLEGKDTRNMESEYWYNAELVFSDGTKELLRKKMHENDIEAEANISGNSSNDIKTHDDGSKSVSQNLEEVSGKTYMNTFIDGRLISGSSEYSAGDRDNYVNISMSFSQNLPLDTIRQVVINDKAYDIEK